MLFMVIEHFKGRDATAVYGRARAKGRIMPEGLRYIESWVETNFDRCFQLVECNDASLLQRWMLAWRDLIDFEIVPVVTSAETVENVRPLLDGSAKQRAAYSGILSAAKDLTLLHDVATALPMSTPEPASQSRLPPDGLTDRPAENSELTIED